MARASTVTVEVRGHLDLFGWARLEAQRIEQEREALAEAIKDEHHASLALERMPQHVALLDARKVLKDAKAAALSGDVAVLDAKATLKSARASVKLLAEAKAVLAAKEQARNLDESVQASERRLASALARGEAPGQQADPEMSNATVELIGPDGQSSGKIPAKDFGRRVREASRVLRLGQRKS